MNLINSRLTSGQRNLTRGRIAAAHGRFNRIRQMAPMCTHLVGPIPIGIRTVLLLSRFENIDRRTRPGMSSARHFSTSQLPLLAWISGSPSNT